MILPEVTDPCKLFAKLYPPLRFYSALLLVIL